MPRIGERRPMIGVKLSAAGVAWADRRAEEEGLLMANGRPNRSEVIRLALAYYQQHAPKGWRPRSGGRA